MMNKLRILLVAALVMMAMPHVYGQAAVSLGVKGGLNFANVNTTSVGAAYDSRTGYHAGAFVSFKFTKLAIQPEIIYSQQGSTVNSIDYSLGYVNIPILLKLYLIGGLNIQAGPQFGFLSSATAGGADIKSTLKSSDTSLALGAGFDVSKLCIDVRYNLGLSEINDAAGSAAAKNQVFQLSLGYKLFKFGN